MISPLTFKILEYYYNNGNEAPEDAGKEWITTCNYLIQDEVLKPEGCHYVLTEKGTAWCHAMMSVEIPTAVWTTGKAVH